MMLLPDHFDFLAQTRKNILEVLDACTLDQLNQIPEKFNNNILWNAAHVIATLDILVYASSGTISGIEPDLVANYKKGTVPTTHRDHVFVDYVKSSLDTSGKKLREDYTNSAFGTYSERVTSYGVKLASVEEAICFNNLHEAMHFGQIKMLHKLVD